MASLEQAARAVSASGAPGWNDPGQGLRAAHSPQTSLTPQQQHRNGQGDQPLRAALWACEFVASGSFSSGWRDLKWLESRGERRPPGLSAGDTDTGDCASTRHGVLVLSGFGAHGQSRGGTFHQSNTRAAPGSRGTTAEPHRCRNNKEWNCGTWSSEPTNADEFCGFCECCFCQGGRPTAVFVAVWVFTKQP